MHQYTGRFKRLRCLERCHMNLYRDIPLGDVRFIGNRSPNLPHLPPLQVAEAQASTDARKEQTYEQKKEHQQLERRDVALKKAQEALASAEKKLLLDSETRAFFETLMNAETRPEQKNLRLLIGDQLKTLSSKSGRCKWHTAVLDWCTDVYRRNPGAYDHMSL